jgi:NAD(P)-dependent dehydrogenase (short-subunit alcohol dehydrogenase family)
LKSSHNVTILARGEAPLRELQSQYPKQVQFIAGDLSDFSLAQTAVDLTVKEFGQLDGLVINHGILPPVAQIGESEIDGWKHNFDINFFSAIAFVSL